MPRCNGIRSEYSSCSIPRGEPGDADLAVLTLHPLQPPIEELHAGLNEGGAGGGGLYGGRQGPRRRRRATGRSVGGARLGLGRHFRGSEEGDTRRFSKREILIGGGRPDAGETRAAEDPAGGGDAGGV